ncbi:alpha/beta hydrolase [Limosilactobacillus sp. STM2_1]|uniref:Alpha/beta hydrolase n=1 Tax=Limosilactobacillus rudii TaxID=2759755 RepID=A0A7W3YM40_9LACO|nr:alpha/beta hydrolase [Limosilactobacillus rudii]MBB1078724.1 alpha/beta hydrolase [Limosilactobacillus rudii]MBB1096708.1 alpha/beta hydrolase [Limosilactobacillus rudii]MCD7135620.1 alpha/beta hydrolase [Limosilactobacillus rudii]
MKHTINIDKVRDGLWLDSNITYTQVPGWLGNTTRDLKLSVIRHFQTNDDTQYPVIFWFAGGGWMDTDHNVHLPNLVDFARHGYIVVGVEYRDSNKVQFPGQLEDAKAAIRYMRANAKRFQADPNRFVAMGESAGGHMASMLGVTNGLTQFDKGDNLKYSSAVQAAIPFYGVVDPLTAKEGSVSNDFDFVYRNLLGAEPETAPDLDSAANPLTYVNANTVPFLILHGTKDVVVPIKDSERLYEKLVENNVPAELYEINGASHMDVAFMQPEVFKIVLTFLKQYLD